MLKYYFYSLNLNGKNMCIYIHKMLVKLEKKLLLTPKMEII